MNPQYLAARSKAVEVLKCFDELVGVGMAGSQALGLEDEYSDLDLQAFATSMPTLDRRKDVYNKREGIEIGLLDHSVAEEFEKPPWVGDEVTGDVIRRYIKYHQHDQGAVQLSLWDD